MKTCFSCDKLFEHHLPSVQIKPEYCSLSCQEEFEAELSQSIQDSKDAGLIDAEGNAILSSASATKSLSPAQITSFIDQLKIKPTSKE